MPFNEDDDRRMSAEAAFSIKELDADFRQYLRAIGVRNGQRQIPMLDHEPLSYLVDVLTIGGPVPLPALIFIPTEGAPFGYRFIWVDEHNPDQDVPMVEASPETRIGMLYVSQPSAAARLRRSL
jgi:hypothetical protein